VDYIIGETFGWCEEALIALDVIKSAGLPAVITLAIHRSPEVREGWSVADACKRLAQAGADVVGTNCIRGRARCCRCWSTSAPPSHPGPPGGAAGALPHPRRRAHLPITHRLGRPPTPHGRPFPDALDPFTCTRYEIATFGRAAYELGARYLGVCCGAGPHHIRALPKPLAAPHPPAATRPTWTSTPSSAATELEGGERGVWEAGAVAPGSKSYTVWS